MPTPKARAKDNLKRIAWLWGEARSGKSTTARVGDYYLKLGNKWWDGYKGEKRVVIDDLGKETAKALTDKLKLWADPHFDQTGETKGGAVLLTFDELIVTANWHPYDVWGETADYEPIKMRFNPGDKMVRDHEKDDEEKITNAVDVRNWNNKNGF